MPSTILLSILSL
jgi:hypothetical protein